MGDWEPRIKRLVDELEYLREQFDCYYEHAVVLFDDSVDLDELKCVVPRISRNYISCDKIARTLDLPITGIGVQRHYFFSTDGSADGLDRFSSILEKHSGALNRIPRSVLPKIKLPQNEFGRSDEILVSWVYALHRIAREDWNRIYSREIQFLNSADEVVAGNQFRNWSESVTLDTFSPVEYLDLEQDANQYANAITNHREAGKEIPLLISSALTKPILYASVNVLAQLSRPVQEKTGDTPRAVKEQFTKSEAKVVAALRFHHGLTTDTPNFNALSEEELGAISGTSQATANRTLERMQKILCRVKNEKPRRSPSDWYKQECDFNTILRVLEFFETPTQIQEILQDKMDHHEDK